MRTDLRPEDLGDLLEQPLIGGRGGAGRAGRAGRAARAGRGRAVGSVTGSQHQGLGLGQARSTRPVGA